MLLIESQDFMIEFHNCDVDRDMKSKQQELKFPKGDFQRFLVSQDLSQKRNIVEKHVESKLVVVLTKDNKTKLHLLCWSEPNWCMTLMT